MNRLELARKIYDVSHITGEFELRSGQISDEYFDKYLFEAQPALLRAIAEQMALLIPEGVDALAGLEMGGIPVVTMLSQVSGVPALFVRRKAKEYGTCKLAEGGDIAGKKLLIVEDVVTSGGQILLSAADLREREAIVEDVLCVIDREAGGLEKLANEGLRLHALFSMSELKVT
ncbi:MAG: orotate phosphoribosyltransferase [Gemmatimonadetes bacterium]|jgi:orotate phosphoribosyltransferase|nr:orotate phosphoribosyltransferase [Gemmatimonadota bacterium]